MEKGLKMRCLNEKRTQFWGKMAQNHVPYDESLGVTFYLGACLNFLNVCKNYHIIYSYSYLIYCLHMIHNK